MEDDDLALLRAWRAGDAGAGEALFERHFDSLFRFLRSKVGDAADDLVQDTFLACVKGRERFREEASFRTYLFAVARNKIIDHWRARGSGIPTISMWSPPTTSAPRPLLCSTAPTTSACW